ncbi:MAG: imidazole glycerol phosphate synthase subunit HisH, partial [Terriglobales bacterium]
MKVAVIDYGGGNTDSVRRALAALGAEVVAAADAAALAAAERVVLPGVGHFGAVMAALDARGLRPAILDFIAAGKPFLGVCVGLQALFAASEEAPGIAGLGLWPGQVRRLRAAKVPHVGWAALVCQTPSRLLAGAGLAPSFYFTHSYVAPIAPATSFAAYYPDAFTAVAEAGNLLGVQFHPEKSGAAGRAVLANFLTWPRIAPVAIPAPPALPTAPARRIIPCLDVHAGRVVKGVQFEALRDSGDPAALAAAYSRQGADELVLLDVSASRENRSAMLDTVRAVAREIWIPLTVGGGVRSVAEAGALLAAGADKVAVNSAALARPELIAEMAGAFGSQAVIAALDARRTPSDEPAWQVFSHGGSRAAGRDAVDWAREAERRGAGEILLTSMD